MLHIFLDISRLLTRLSNGLLPTGVDRVGLAYVTRYRAQARAVLSEAGYSKILSERDSKRAFDMLLGPAPGPMRVRSLVARAIVTPSLREKFEHAVLLHTSHNGMEYLRYYEAMRRRNIRTVFMVHDLIPITHSEYCRPGVDAQHRRRIHTALRHADGFITNSRDTFTALQAEAERVSLPMPPATVAHLAPGVTSRAALPRPLDHPYFVMLSTIEPRKNHWFMLHTWRRLVETYGEAAPKLVIVGRRGWECENVVDMLERCEAIQGSVIEESSCSDERLRAWLLHAQALLFPSFTEGYGMPLVEALTLGTPVLASDLDVFREVAGDTPDYLDPLDGPGWFSRIRDYSLPGSAARQAQLARITGYQVPTWQQHFTQVDRFLASLCK